MAKAWLQRQANQAASFLKSLDSALGNDGPVLLASGLQSCFRWSHKGSRAHNFASKCPSRALQIAARRSAATRFTLLPSRQQAAASMWRLARPTR